VLDEGHNPGDRSVALELAMTLGDTIPIGILYKTEPRDTFGRHFREKVTDRSLSEMNPPDRDLIVEMLSNYRFGYSF
jgi:hypothetical protein